LLSGDEGRGENSRMNFEGRDTDMRPNRKDFCGCGRGRSAFRAGPRPIRASRPAPTDPTAGIMGEGWESVSHPNHCSSRPPASARGVFLFFNYHSTLKPPLALLKIICILPGALQLRPMFPGSSRETNGHKTAYAARAAYAVLLYWLEYIYEICPRNKTRNDANF
jgi:hypothetical protein